MGNTVLDYSGPARSKEWVNDPTNDVRYVWADENEAEALATHQPEALATHHLYRREPHRKLQLGRTCQ